MKFIVVIFMLFPMLSSADSSICYGTTGAGSLTNGVRLPQSGENFIGYSLAARAAGRTYVHSEVKKIIVNSYKALEQQEPDKVYKYAETGFKEGGRFKPHKTHQNGLSVDFMVPVVNKYGKSVHLPTHVFNRLGYDIEFDAQNRYKGYRMDFVAMAAHIVQLHRHAVDNGHDLWRVILAPELQPYLYETQYAEYLRNNIQFSKKRSWVRHDDHYHVDFSVACKE